MTKDIVQLRPHHLGLCLQTYSGAGYTPEFVANMTAVAERLNAGAAVKIVRGPDEICQPMLQNGEKFHCYERTTVMRDLTTMSALRNTLGIPLLYDEVFQLTQPDWSKLRKAFREGSSRDGCLQCKWQNRCNDVAVGGFRSTIMRCGLE